MNWLSTCWVTPAENEAFDARKKGDCQVGPAAGNHEVDQSQTPWKSERRPTGPSMIITSLGEGIPQRLRLPIERPLPDMTGAEMTRLYPKDRRTQ